MNIQTHLLPSLSAYVVSYLEENKYSDKTLEHYRCTYNQLYRYLNEKHLSEFNQELGIIFIDEHYKNAKEFSCRSYYSNLKRRIFVLFEYHNTASVTTKRFSIHVRELLHLRESMNQYTIEQQKRSLAAKTIDNKIKLTKDFLCYLEDNGFNSLESLSVSAIYEYLGTKKESAVSTREGILYVLRDALSFFSEQNFCNPELKKLFPQISTHSEDPVPSCFTPAELKMILSSVDRSTPIGKRDYTILVISSFLGLRAGDIREFKIGSIKWGDASIEITQSKTGQFLQLPLLDEIKFAILDYLKNGRPKTNSDFLFLRHSAPYEPFESHNCFYYVINKYLHTIELNGRKHGIHALRFSAAGNMLSNGTPITTICNILGHTYSNTTKKYLKIDIDNLRKAALEVEV